MYYFVSPNSKQHNDSYSTEFEFSMNDPYPYSIKELIAMCDSGNTWAFDKLDIAYMDYEHGDFLPFALKMADEFDYPQAYYEVYIQLLKETGDSLTTISLDSCDQDTREKAISYLKKGADRDCIAAIDELSELYDEGKFVLRDTIKSKGLMRKSKLLQTKLIIKGNWINENDSTNIIAVTDSTFSFLYDENLIETYYYVVKVTDSDCILHLYGQLDTINYLIDKVTSKNLYLTNPESSHGNNYYKNK